MIGSIKETESDRKAAKGKEIYRKYSRAIRGVNIELKSVLEISVFMDRSR
jgi:hypothetical protein